jgi:hypothetical protein
MGFPDFLKFFNILIAGLLLNSLISDAQDHHYWSQQYGAESTLLGGAMVGGVSDNSAVYYNPGAVAFIANPSLSIDANVYRIDRIFISDGAGEGVNLNSAQISIYPQIISGMVNLVKNDRIRFSYALLTRNHNNVLMNTRYTGKSDLSDPVDPSGTYTSFVGAYDYVNQLDEQWLGLGAGYRISEKLGLGMTLFGTYRGQSYQLTNYVREVNYTGSAYNYGTVTNDEAVKYYSVRVLAKFGLSYLADNWKFGLTLTTPSFRLSGNGSVQRENSDIVVSENNSDMSGNFIIMDQNSNARTNYRHPLSIAGGIDYQTSRTRLAVSAEIFAGIKDYFVMKTVSDPFVYPPSYLDSASVKPVIDSYLDVEGGARPVFNFAIGLNQAIFKRINLLLGASTDFSSFDASSEGSEMNSGFGAWDIYHLSAGLSYHRDKHTVTLGCSYSFTPSQSIPPYTIINQTPEFTDKALLSSHSWAVVLGYIYYFKRVQ